MDFVILLLLIVIFVLVFQQKTSINDGFERLELRILNLQDIIKSLEYPKETAVKDAPAPKPVVAPIEEVVIEPLQIIEDPAPKIVADYEFIEEFAVTPVLEQHYDQAPEVPHHKEPKLSFFERHPDLEKFIGENLINKIGIAILVLSIGYFVKYAIDSNWIGEIGRVAIGVVCGGILIGVAHKMRNDYDAFSSVLVGGGLAVFYFTITLAFHQFNLFNQITAFIILIVITIFAVVLSLLYNKQELAVIALVGGILSPFLLSTGNANYNSLLLYLVILNIGLLVIAYYKSWRILNITAFALTVLVFVGILTQLTGPTFYLGFIYATIFYLLFFAINIAYNVRESKSFVVSDFSILLVNTGLYFAIGLYLLTQMHYEQYRGLFTASLAVINLGLSYLLFRNRKVDSNVLYLLIGITLSFISLTAPIQLKGNQITLFWATEAVVLYWLYLKSEIKFTRITSLGIWVAMLISLVMDWMLIYSSGQEFTVLANKGFITTVFAAAATFILAVLVKKDHIKAEPFEFRIPRIAFHIVGIVILFLAGFFEVNHQFTTRYTVAYLNIVYLMLYVSAFALILHLASQKVALITMHWTAKLAILSAPIAMYFICYFYFFSVQQDILDGGQLFGNHFIAHWISSVLIGILFYLLIAECRKNLEEGLLNKAIWIICVAIVLFLSLDLNLASNMLFYSKAHSFDEVQRIYIKTGLPVLWGVLSFAMMWLGMKFKDRTLRIVSLSLFSLTLLKLFLFDIRNIPAAGKIVAFFCLGVLLLIVSFMYQKVKKIIISDEEKPNIDEQPNV